MEGDEELLKQYPHQMFTTNSVPAVSLQDTLDHPDSFAAFRQWLQANGTLDVLELWLAIWAFRRALRERDPRAQRIGCAFHRRFISPRTGSCTFLPSALRADCSARLQQCTSMRADFFDACIPHVWTRLTQEHARFVTQTVEKDDAFARELAEKLDRLAMERAEDEEDIGFHRRDAESPETTTMTPERMCAWMERFADGHGLTALSYPSAHSSSGSTTGYTSLRQSVPPTAHCSDSASSGFCSSSKSYYPAMTGLPLPASSSSCSVPPVSAPLLTITYRESGGVAPFVVRIEPRAAVTFRDFRRLFGIPTRNNKRFLFKEHCHDPGEADHHRNHQGFQWTAIYEDESPLPVFGGQIVAECRNLSGSD